MWETTAHINLTLGNLGAHTFPFNSLQGTLKAISTSKQTGKDVFTLSLPTNWTLIQGALLQLLNCTRIALDWSQSIENQFGDTTDSD